MTGFFDVKYIKSYNMHRLSGEFPAYLFGVGTDRPWA